MRFNTVAPASVSIIATQGEGGALLPYVSKVGVRCTTIGRGVFIAILVVNLMQSTGVNVALVMPGILTVDEVRVVSSCAYRLV